MTAVVAGTYVLHEEVVDVCTYVGLFYCLAMSFAELLAPCPVDRAESLKGARKQHIRDSVALDTQIEWAEHLIRCLEKKAGSAWTNAYLKRLGRNAAGSQPRD